MSQPGRKYTNGSGYRYGFNGKEMDKDIANDDYDFGARMQDSRLGGRFFSTDPMSIVNAGESPYTFAGNSPIGLTDFEGLFKISPYFVKKYPTLAKLLKNVLPTYINNTTVRDNWIRAIGFEDKNKGIAVWTEMLTYGKGPWITPTISKKELLKNGGGEGLSLYQGRFGEGSGNSWEHDSYADNISFSNSSLSALESALKSGNDEEVAFNALKAMILVMHESGHWARFMKAGKENRTGGPYEDGALVEEYVFGIRFSYTSRCPPGVKYCDGDAIREDKIRETSNGVRATLNVFFGNDAISSLLRLGKTPEGHNGDPVLKAARIKEGKIFKSPSTGNTGGNSGTAKKGDFSY